MNCPAQIPNSFAVNYANLEDAALAASENIFGDKLFDVLGGEVMKIENSVYRVFNSVIGRFRHEINLTICPLPTRLNFANHGNSAGKYSLAEIGR